MKKHPTPRKILKATLIIGLILAVVQVYWFGLWLLLGALNLKFLFLSPLWIAPLLLFVLYVAARLNGFRLMKAIRKRRRGIGCPICGRSTTWRGTPKTMICKPCGRPTMGCLCKELV